MHDLQERLLVLKGRIDVLWEELHAATDITERDAMLDTIASATAELEQVHVALVRTRSSERLP